MTAILCACGGGQKTQVTLNGTTDLADGEVLILSYRLNADSTVTDTIAVANGQFTYTTNVDRPTQAVIFNGVPSRNNYRMRNFYLEPGTTSFVLEGDNYTGAEVKGSQLTFEKDSLNTVYKSIYDLMSPLYARYEEAQNQNDTTTMASISNEMDGYTKQLKDVKTDFIKSHPSSYVSAELLPAMQSSLDLEELKALYNSLSPEVQAEADATGKYIAAMENLTPGNPAPTVAGKNQNGEEVSLEGLKGKVVLLDFWATWCGPCRASLPHVKELWEQYNGKGLEVLAVSLDRDQDAWKDYIANSGMGMENYVNIFDEGGVNADGYAIQFIPSKFIIDRDGNFVGRFDNEEELNAKLAELLAD